MGTGRTRRFSQSRPVDHLVSVHALPPMGGGPENPLFVFQSWSCKMPGPVDNRGASVRRTARCGTPIPVRIHLLATTFPQPSDRDPHSLRSLALTCPRPRVTRAPFH